MPVRDPIDPTKLHSTGRRGRFGMRDPRRGILPAFENAEQMKWRQDAHWRRFGADHTPQNLEEVNRISAGARTIKVCTRDPKTGRSGDQLQGIHSVTIGGQEVPVENGEIVILDSGLGNEILDQSRAEAKALDDFIATSLAGGDMYIHFSHPAMYAEMKEARVLPSDLAACVPSSQDTADKVWYFGRVCRKYLNTITWSGKAPSVGSTSKSKSSKQDPHGEKADGRAVAVS